MRSSRDSKRGRSLRAVEYLKRRKSGARRRKSPTKDRSQCGLAIVLLLSSGEIPGRARVVGRVGSNALSTGRSNAEGVTGAGERMPDAVPGRVSPPESSKLDTISDRRQSAVAQHRIPPEGRALILGQ